MNKLKKLPLQVNIKDAFECIKDQEYFTKGRIYKIQNVDFDSSTSDTSVKFLDDDCDMHIIREKFLSEHFKKI
tara:strand:+ start:300 stop:518 length:219 start_codon:yes stop_codon:yes gene_type:complete